MKNLPGALVSACLVAGLGTTVQAQQIPQLGPLPHFEAGYGKAISSGRSPPWGGF